MVGAGAGDEEPAGLQELQGAKIDLLVAALSRGDAITILGEGRWVEDHHLEFAAHMVIFLQYVKGIAFAKSDVGDDIQLLISACGSNRSGCHIACLHMLAVAGHRESEAAVVAEAVEHFARSIAPSSQVVLALVKKGASFLPSAQGVDKSDSVFLGDNLVRNLTVQRGYGLVEAFEQAHLWVVSFENALG